MIYNLFLKFHMRHEWFSGLRLSDEGGDVDLIFNFCWPECYFSGYVYLYYKYILSFFMNTGDNTYWGLGSLFSSMPNIINYYDHIEMLYH